MRHTLGAFAIVAGSLAGPVAAQESDVIVVTATRTPSAARDLPARVEVIDRADIEARGLATIASAIGAEAVQSGGAGQQASVFLRGTNSKHVLALFDGVRVNDASTPNAQYDFGLDTLGGLERVEVLRGPASAIYGSDAIGGVVNMLPRRGGEAPFAPYYEASAGSFDAYRALAGATGTAGGLAYGVSGEWFGADGHDLVPERMTTHSGDPDGASASTLVASARLDAGAFGYDALLRVRDSRAEFDTFSGGPFFDLRADDSDLESDMQQALWRLGADMETAPAFTLRLSGGQVLSDRAETDAGVETSSAESTRTFADATARYASRATTVTAGLSLERNEIDTIPQFASPLAVGEDQSAAYLIVQSRATAAVVTAALRLDDYENFGAHTTYAVGAVYDLAPLRLFVSYGTAFKAPSLSERFETSFFNVGNPDLDPETSRSWEVGVDWLSGGASRAGASYYRTDVESLIEYDFAALQNVNIGEAEIEGAEAYMEARVAPWARLRLRYAWTDARNGVTGAQLARRPEHVVSFDAHISPNERLEFVASWTYLGDRRDVTYDDAGQFADAAGEVDGFVLAALAGTYELGARTELFARIDNVTDETYEQPAAFAGAPRAVTFGVRAAF